MSSKLRLALVACLPIAFAACGGGGYEFSRRKYRATHTF